MTSLFLRRYLGAHLNSFSKPHIKSLILTLFVCASVFAPEAFGLNIHALYTSACQREVGVILKVDEKFVYLLNLQGEVKSIRPYEIIYLAYYPAEYFPAQGPARFADVEQLIITTLIDNEPVELARGWPLGYTTDEISLLNETGQEQIIQRRNIYSLSFQTKQSATEFQLKGRAVDFEFEHPFAFRSCPLGAGRKDKQIFPQQTLNQPIAIKRELDELKASYLRLQRYANEQRFYAIPEIYKNQTSLGVWTSFGSRYGSSSSRSNNLTPVLTDAYSSDIFDYQHIFVTGSAPMSFASHEEAQTQAYYSFKASYFHFAFMMDPNLILVGSQYQWREADFTEPDVRLNDANFMEMGVDFGSLSLQLHLGNTLQLGAYDSTSFMQSTVNVTRFGLAYQKPSWKIDGFWGSGEAAETRVANDRLAVGLSRVNFYCNPQARVNWQISYIRRSIAKTGAFTIDSTSNTLAGYVGYRFWKRYEGKGFAAVESLKQNINGTAADKTVPKIGIALSLYF